MDLRLNAIEMLRVFGVSPTEIVGSGGGREELRDYEDAVLEGVLAELGVEEGWEWRVSARLSPNGKRVVVSVFKVGMNATVEVVDVRVNDNTLVGSMPIGRAVRDDMDGRQAGLFDGQGGSAPADLGEGSE